MTTENVDDEGEVVNMAANMMTEIECLEVAVKIDDQPVTTGDGLTLKAYTTSEGGEPVCQVSGDKLEVSDDGDGYVCADVLEEKLPVNDNGDTTYYVEVSYTDGGQTFTSNRTANSFRQAIIKLTEEPGSYTIKVNGGRLASALFTLDGGTFLENEDITVTENGTPLTRYGSKISVASRYCYDTSDGYSSVEIGCAGETFEMLKLSVWNGLTGDFVFTINRDGVTYSANVTVVKE